MTDVFLCLGKRSAIGRHGGALARLRPDDMAAQVIDGLLEGRALPVAEVILGCGNQTSAIIETPGNTWCSCLIVEEN